MRSLIARPAIKLDHIEGEIAQLRDLDLSSLRERWNDLYGRPAPKHFRREFLIRGIAYQIQVKAFGGLKLETKQRLRKVAESMRSGKQDSLLASSRIKPGTKLLRSWKDKIHIVTVLENGLEWQRRRYNSLSEVARAITGTRWNGHLFFGIKTRHSPNKNALKRTERAHG